MRWVGSAGCGRRVQLRQLARFWVLLLCLVTPGLATAQSSSGSIYGEAEPGDGVTVQVENTGTGFKRELPVDATGRFVFNALPPGSYTVFLKKAAVATRVETVTVVAGVGSSVNFGGVNTISVTHLDEVEVHGGAIITPIDISTAQTTTIYSAQRIEVIPVAKDVTSVALLAPGTTKGDAAFGNLASFGGSSVAENSYYVNGFNVTNLFKNLSYSQIPFYAIAEEQVITGGYGPEYGLSTGGVVSLNTAKGSNQWMAGGAFTWEPNSLREKRPKTFTSAAEPYRDYTDGSLSQKIYDVWAGGPILQDKLFIYGIIEFTKLDKATEPNSFNGGNFETLDQKNPFGLAKLSWSLSDNHILDFTYINDTRKYDFGEYATAPNAEGFLKSALFSGADHVKEGGGIYVLGYTGYLNDDLTLTAQYGILKSKREEYQNAPDGKLISYDGVVGNFNQPGCPLVLEDSTYDTFHSDSVSSCWITTTIPTAVGKDERKAGRIDLEYQVPGFFYGTHTLKAGFEQDKWSTFYGESYSGGNYYKYFHRPGGTDGDPATPDDQPAGADVVAGTKDDNDYVRVRHFQTGANVAVNTTAFYLKDSWDLDRGVLLSLGLRNDSFENLNGAKQAYVKQDNIWQPRLGVAWDVLQDASQKLYGSWGIYSLPIAATVAVRGASASIFSQQNFAFTAIDPATGAPTLGESQSSIKYLNAESGTTPNPASVASKGLDPTIQHEFILGYQLEVFDGWTGGVRATLRDLKSTIDDMCDSRPFEQWAVDNGKTYGPAADFPGCFLFNPGQAMDISGDIDGDGVVDNIHLTPEMIGSPAVKRRYYGMEFALEKTTPKWFTQLSYTWAHNFGNAEGLVKSDIGQDDTGTTQDFDFPELMVNSYGNLPNDRRHTLKGTGGFKLTDEWGFSGGVLVQSGRPKNCFGVDPVDIAFGYGASYFACGGRGVPRGTAGRTAWQYNIDFGVSYQPNYVAGLTLQAKVFNLLDRHAVTSVDETGETELQDTNPGPDGNLGTADDFDFVYGVPLSSYGAPTSYQAPRYFQFSARYDFNF